MAPLISSATGILAHNAILTINGSGFGTKSPVAPVVWDDCSHGQPISARWTGYEPSACADPNFNLAYKPSQRGVTFPHNFMTAYLTGCAGGAADSIVYYNSGGPCSPYKTRTWFNGMVSFFSWRRRYDPNWNFAVDSSMGDHNNKIWNYNLGGGLVSNYTTYLSTQTTWGFDYLGTTNGSPHVLLGFNPEAATGPTPMLKYEEAAAPPYNFNEVAASYTLTWGSWSDPGFIKPRPKNELYGWSQMEMVGKWHDSNGSLKTYDLHPVLSNGFKGGQIWATPPTLNTSIPDVGYDHYPTDRWGSSPVPTRTEGMYCYTGMRFGDPNNWRYLCDIYLDYTWSRVCIGDSNIYDNCTTREMQIPTSWSDTQINVALKQNTLSNLTGSWLYVIDANDVPSAAFQLGGGPPPGPSISGLTLNPTSVQGGNLSQGTVTISSAAPAGGTVVALLSGNTSVATVPSNVTVAQGATTATFNITTFGVGTLTPVLITAILGGTQTATLSVTPPVIIVVSTPRPGFGISV